MKDVKLWMWQSKDDFITAEVNYKCKRYYASVYFCEQSLEKALKALWLKKFKKKFPFTHDLTFLMKKLELPDKFSNICKDLTSVYEETRYPTDEVPSEKFLKADADKLLKETKEALEWVKKMI